MCIHVIMEWHGNGRCERTRYGGMEVNSLPFKAKEKKIFSSFYELF